MKGLVSFNGKLTISEKLKKPIAKENEVLVRVGSTAINPADPDIASGLWDDFFPKRNELSAKTGFEFSGIVAENSALYKEGDKIFGYIDVFSGGNWAHQEYITIPEACVAKMPSSISFEEAGIVPMAAQTSLSALRDVASISADEELLIIGAAGGLGVYAIQIAKIFKAKVTAVGNTGQEEFLKSLGAEHTVSYSTNDITKLKKKFDVILDLSTAYTYAQISHLLTDNGRFIPADPNKNASDLKEGTESAAKTRYLMVPKGVNKDLELIQRWIDDGVIMAPVDQVFDLSEFELAMKRLASNGKKGRIVLRINNFSQ